ncbi:MAG: hypothetical protein IT196_15185 [Acidimicrobiales bacterium]|jgi:hypothetical protein|nr:hypothetical protein [Acidimicrobiales bacterium]
MVTDPGRQEADPRRPAHSAPPRPPARHVRPFTRLARTHAMSAAGDGAVAIALAGSLFFSLDYEAARWRVVLYLVLTLLPFTVVAPLIGPAIDRLRGGARWIIIGACAVRALMALLMVAHIDTLLLFPEAFTMLVMGKGYQVAKSAYLPTVVDSDEQLVASNSKLAVLSALSAVVGGAPATLLSKFGGASWAIAVAVLWFGAATAAGFAIPTPRTKDIGAPTDAERAELSSAGVRVAASAMGLLRASVGFLTLWIAFELRARSASPIEFALVLGPLGAGAITGAAIAPRLRSVLSEEWMLGGALAVTTAAGIVAALMGGLAGAAFIAAGVALVSASAKLAFDSLVQRDAPNADHGRAFASYEARFQLLWVVGALCGVLLPFPLRLGFATVAVGAMGTGALFVLGRRAIAAGSAPPKLSEVVLRVMSEPVPAPAPAPVTDGVGTGGARPSSAGPNPGGPRPGPAPDPTIDQRMEPTRELPAVPQLPDGDDPTMIVPPPGHDPRQGWR